MASGTRVYKEGILWKRQRGLHKKGSALRWQERYCRLTNVSLDYFDPKKMNDPKGQFKVEQICIVEIVSKGLFEKLKGNPFQVGDCSEVMYFATKTPQERTEWMESFRQASKDKNIKMLSQYHPGVYSLTNKDRWSCCGRAFRESEGCRNTSGERIRSQTTAIDFLDAGNKSPSPLSVTKNSSKEDLSSSFTSTTSNSTLTEDQGEFPIRTFTISDAAIKRPSLSKTKRMIIAKSLADPPGSPVENSSPSPTTPTPTEEKDVSINKKKKNDEKGNHPPASPSTAIIPPQIEDLSRRSSGASSPAPSTDSGRGTSSRPSSMLTNEGEPLPLTPQSARSHATIATTDSDQTKSLGGGSEGEAIVRRRYMDTQSILSDVSGLSAFSGTLPLHLRKRNRPQSVVYKDGVAFSISEMSITSNESTATDIGLMKLHQACKDGNLNIVRDELDTGAPIGEQEIFNGVPMLPLFISFLHDHRHVMIYLLEHGADPNALDMTTRSCLLHWACQRGCLEAVKILINFKADINMRNHEDNTPLCEASKNGHIEVAETLLDSGAMVDFEGGQNHTPLHHAASAGHSDIVELLIQRGANPTKNNSKKRTPYQLAFLKNNSDVLQMLSRALPSSVKPYALKGSHVSDKEQVITSVDFVSTANRDETKLVTGSRDCMTNIFSITEEGLIPTNELRLANTILSVASHAPYIAMGSTFIQVADVISDSGWRRTVADDAHEDESLEDPPLHLVSFTNEGLLVTAGVESNCVKIWPSIAQDSVISQPLSVYTVEEKKARKGNIYRLTTSPAPDSPWIGVVIQPGPLLTPVGNKKVHIYNWKEEKVYHIIDAGHGGVLVGVHIAFTNDGSHFIVACKHKLTKWCTKTGDGVLCIVQEEGLSITCIAVSPDGRHIALGLESGDTHILDSESGALIFPLRYQGDSSPVSCLAYSKCNSYLATGHTRGSIQLWEVHNSSQDKLLTS